MKGRMVGKTILLSKIERQLLVYDIIYFCQVIEFREITSRIPMSKRMIQRDIQELTDAGLISIVYSRKERGYIHKGVPEFNEKIEGKKREHLKKLYRLGTLMRHLYDDDKPSWEKEFDPEGTEYFTAKDSYYELFPDSTERTRIRDFETLQRIGYEIYYDIYDHCFVQDFWYELREDFGVIERDGKLYRQT